MSNVLPVATRYNKRRSMPSLRDAQEALGGTEITTVANDYSATIRAINFGRPLAKIAPRSLVRPDLQSLVNRVSDSSLAMSPSRR
jgi:Flp pilus assembly CpaE family ATPase